jgi:copper(I)-binding protein
MMKITLCAATLALTAATAAAGVNIVDNNQRVTVDCAKEKTVNKATVTLRGTCDAVNISGNKASVKGSAVLVNVSGNNNTLAMDAVDGVLVSGNENTVSYRKAVKERSTRLADSGNDNKISRVK